MAKVTLQKKLSPAQKEHLETRKFRLIHNVSIFDVLDMFGVDYHCARGSSGSAHCPFHGWDDTPSAYVYGDSNRIYCHKEQRGWDAIGFFWTKLGGKRKIKYTKMLYQMERAFNLPRLPDPSEIDVEEDPVEEPDEVAREELPEDPKTHEAKPEPESESEPKPQVKDSPEAADAGDDDDDDDYDELRKQLWKVSRRLDEVLIEERDRLDLSTFRKLCHLADRTLHLRMLGRLTDEQMQTRLSKIRQRVYAKSDA